MARMQPDVMEELLARPIIAVISTIRKDGRPYQVPVWFLWRDGVFWITGTYERVWCRHIFREPRVSLCIEATEPAPRFVAVDATAEPVEQPGHDIWPISEALARKYLLANPKATEETVRQFMANMRTEPRLLFRLVPEHTRAIDLTVYHGSRGDRAHQRRMAGAAGGGEE